MARNKSDSSGKYRKMRKGFSSRRMGGVKSKPEPEPKRESRSEPEGPITRGKRIPHSQQLVPVADALNGIEGLDAFQKRLPKVDQLQSQLNSQLLKAIKAKNVLHEYKGKFRNGVLPRTPERWTPKERIVYNELPDGHRLSVTYFNEQIAKREGEIQDLQKRLGVFRKK